MSRRARCKTAPLELRPQARRRRQHGAARRVEPAQPGVGPGDRHPRAGMQILGELGVKRGGEGGAVASRPGARGPAERAFGRDVQMVRRERRDQPREPAARRQDEADFGIGGTRDGAEPVGPDHLHHMPHRAQFRSDGRERAHYAVDLRHPCVGDDQDAPPAMHSRRRRRHENARVRQGPARPRRAPAAGPRRKAGAARPTR